MSVLASLTHWRLQVGDEPIFGLGDSLNNGLPVTAFDSSQEAELGGSTAAGPEPVQEQLKQLSILSPSGELSREPGILITRYVENAIRSIGTHWF